MRLIEEWWKIRISADARTCHPFLNLERIRVLLKRMYVLFSSIKNFTRFKNLPLIIWGFLDFLATHRDALNI